MKNNDGWCLGYGSLYCCISVASTPVAVDLVVQSQCVWLKKTFQAVLSKEKKPSFDWTDLHAPLKVLSNTRCEFALLKCDAARLTLQISKTKQPTLASFLPTKVGNTWMTGRNHHSCYWMILVSFHSLATHEHCSCNLTSLRGSDTVKRPHFSRDQIQDYPLVPRRPQ